jgi:hypothetical protein
MARFVQFDSSAGAFWVNPDQVVVVGKSHVPGANTSISFSNDSVINLPESIEEVLAKISSPDSN